MGLATGLAGVGVAVSAADAPPAVLYHPVGVVAAVSGMWHQLAYGSVDEALKQMCLLVEEKGGMFHPCDVWVYIAPGARETFRLDARGRSKLFGDPETGLMPNGLKSACLPFQHRFIFLGDDGSGREYGLDLSGLFYDLWLQAGVPFDQIYFDPRNTMTARNRLGRYTLASKRVADAMGKSHWASTIVAITL